MTSTLRESRYIKSSVAHNNNKFWYITECDDASCLVQFGRVGGEGAQKRHSFDSQNQATSFFDRKCREKEGERKGYRRLQVVEGAAGYDMLARENLVRVAVEQIRTDSPQTQALVRHLTDVNAHKILSATTLQFDAAQGLFRTPCGIVTRTSLATARGLLTRIGRYVARREFHNPAYLHALDDYLMLIPQKVGRKLDPTALFPDREAVRRQSDLLDALDASLQSVLAQAEAKTVEHAMPRIFDVQLHLVESRKETRRIRTMYRSTLQAVHACAHLDVQRVWAVEVASMQRAWDERGQKVGNVSELWHGTRASNLLSILKGGLAIPPQNAPYCTGRMFGNGVYFSDQSTKALNYAYGYWQGQANPTCFMFLADVALGRAYVPRSHTESLPRPGYDSTFARAGESGVLNNEMVVYQTSQVNLRFLVEFGSAR
jgi:poly [ADP-ribose] polymerase